MNAFLDRTLPHADWTHEAHLRFAWLILQKYDFAKARLFAREKIDHYNQKVGFRIGYHETITRAYLSLVRVRMAKEALGDFLSFKKTNLDLFEPGLKTLYLYYSKDRLWLPEAKLNFVEPDLLPLP